MSIISKVRSAFDTAAALEVRAPKSGRQAGLTMWMLQCPHHAVQRGIHTVDVSDFALSFAGAHTERARFHSEQVPVQSIHKLLHPGTLPVMQIANFVLQFLAGEFWPL